MVLSLASKKHPETQKLLDNVLDPWYRNPPVSIDPAPYRQVSFPQCWVAHSWVFSRPRNGTSSSHRRVSTMFLSKLYTNFRSFLKGFPSRPPKKVVFEDFVLHKTKQTTRFSWSLQRFYSLEPPGFCRVIQTTMGLLSQSCPFWLRGGTKQQRRRPKRRLPSALSLSPARELLSDRLASLITPNGSIGGRGPAGRTTT